MPVMPGWEHSRICAGVKPTKAPLRMRNCPFGPPNTLFSDTFADSLLIIGNPAPKNGINALLAPDNQGFWTSAWAAFVDLSPEDADKPLL